MLNNQNIHHAIFDQLPNFIFWKDKKCKIQGGNALFVQAAGGAHLEDVKGKRDHELPWREFADEYASWDHEILRGLHLNNHIEQHKQTNHATLKVIVNKKPLYECDEIVGIVGSFTILHTEDDVEHLALPPQQKNCLKLVASGLSAKQIANKMHLSPRTVEYYIAILKEKLNCRNKADLIIKACHL